MQAKVDWNKPVQVTCQNEWRDAKVAHVFDNDESALLVWRILYQDYWDAYPADSPLIRNKPQTRECWVNVYLSRADVGFAAYSYPSKEIADARAMDDRLACVKVYEEEVHDHSEPAEEQPVAIQPPAFAYWINVYPKGCSWYQLRKSADEVAVKERRVALLYVTYDGKSFSVIKAQE